MKGFPETLEQPLGPWRAKVKQLIAQANNLQTAEQLLDLLGQPDSQESSDDRPGAKTWTYVDPARPRFSYLFDVLRSGRLAGRCRQIVLAIPDRDDEPHEPVIAGSLAEPQAPDKPTQAEVAAAESQLGVCFPDGYREFVCGHGEGILAGYIRIYPPRRILTGVNNVDEWRRRVAEYWFWDEGRDVLTKQQVLKSTIIGDTVDGDEIISCPDQASRIYVLPRHSGRIYLAGKDLPSAIEWVCSSGVLVEPTPDRRFESFSNHA